VKLYPEQFNRFANERSELAFWMKIIKIGSNYLYEDIDDDDYGF